MKQNNINQIKNDSIKTQAYESTRSENNQEAKNENKYNWIWKALIPVVIGLIPIWFEYREIRRTNKTKIENEKSSDDNKTNNKIKLDDKKTDNKIRIENARTENKLKIIERQQMRDEAKAKIKQEGKEVRYGFSFPDKSESCNSPKKAKPLDEELALAEEDPTKLQLGWELLHKNLDCSFLSETQAGKTTFIFLLCYLLAAGIKNKELFPNWHCSTRVAVLYFALEQTHEEIKQHYPLENVEASKYFRLVTGAQNIKDVLEYIKSFMEEFPEGDVLIVIDNITVLKDDNGVFAIKMLNKALSSYRKLRTNGTLTTWRVYHADPTKVKEGKPLKLSMIADNRNSGMRANELIIINKFPNNSTMRYMIPRKQKIGGKPPQDCYLFDYSIEEDEYYFLGEYKLPEVLQMLEDEKNGNQPKLNNKPGPKRQCGFSDEEMLLIYEDRECGLYTEADIKALTYLDTPQFNRAIKRIKERQQRNQQP